MNYLYNIMISIIELIEGLFSYVINNDNSLDIIDDYDEDFDQY